MLVLCTGGNIGYVFRTSLHMPSDKMFVIVILLCKFVPVHCHLHLQYWHKLPLRLVVYCYRSLLQWMNITEMFFFMFCSIC